MRGSLGANLVNRICSEPGNYSQILRDLVNRFPLLCFPSLLSFLRVLVGLWQAKLMNYCSAKNPNQTNAAYASSKSDSPCARQQQVSSAPSAVLQWSRRMRTSRASLRSRPSASQAPCVVSQPSLRQQVTCAHLVAAC